MPAKDPLAVDLTKELMREAKQDSAQLADLLFGQDAFLDSRNVKRPEYLRWFQVAWMNGLPLPNGTVMTAATWRAKQLDRTGHERFWKDAHDAFGLSAAEGLAKVQLAMTPQMPELPEIPEEEEIDG